MSLKIFAEDIISKMQQLIIGNTIGLSFMQRLFQDICMPFVLNKIFSLQSSEHLPFELTAGVYIYEVLHQLQFFGKDVAGETGLRLKVYIVLVEGLSLVLSTQVGEPPKANNSSSWGSTAPFSVASALTITYPHMDTYTYISLKHKIICRKDFENSNLLLVTKYKYTKKW